MAVPTLGGVTLNGCESIGTDKNANILQLAMPLGDSDETEIFDMLGVTKMINITGNYAGANIAATKAFIDSLEALADGDQSVITFSSDQTGSISCMVGSVQADWELPGFKVDYTIKLIQGTTL